MKFNLFKKLFSFIFNSSLIDTQESYELILQSKLESIRRLERQILIKELQIAELKKENIRLLNERYEYDDSFV